MVGEIRSALQTMGKPRSLARHRDMVIAGLKELDQHRLHSLRDRLPELDDLRSIRDEITVCLKAETVLRVRSTLCSRLSLQTEVIG